MTVHFDLPPPREDAVPAFTTAKACAEWREALPLANAATAQAQLRAQLGLLPSAGLRPPVLFDMLEQMRDAVIATQADVGKRYIGRALPLADFELVAATGSFELWRAFVTCHLVCVQAVLHGERDFRPGPAAVCQRAMDAQGRLILDMLLAGYEVPATEWQLLHKLLRAAEEAGVAHEKVRDRHLRETTGTHCAATYTRPILLALGGPNEWGAKQTLMIARLIERWANKVEVSALAPDMPTKPPVMVDLSSGRGGYRPEIAGDVTGQDLRYIDISGLAQSIKNRVVMLRKGESPVKLGLGEDFPMPGGEQLLYQLYKHWGDGRTGREMPRRISLGTAMITHTLEATHYYIGGKPFKQPVQSGELTARQRQEIATFGRIATRHDDDHSQNEGFSLESWMLRDESMAGLRMTRAPGLQGARLKVGHLIAARPADARAFMVGSVRWAQVQSGGELMIGVRAFPGAAGAVAVKPTGVNAAGEKFQQALLLPPVPALHSPESLVVASGTFKAGKVVEVQADIPFQAKLESVIERGADFERCAFARA